MKNKGKPSLNTCVFVIIAPKRAFLRRTKATAPPDFSPDTEVTTSKYKRTNFKTRASTETPESTKLDEVQPTTPEGDPKTPEKEIGGKRVRRPSLNSGGVRSERPTRNYVRRRPGGANATSTSTTPSPSSSSPSLSSSSTRRPFRVASRRRLPSTISTSITTTTDTPPTTLAISEEWLQDIGDTDAIEDPNLLERTATNRTKTRRPLLLKDETVDQNPSATNEDERKRHSKKYSASFKQNQLDEVLKQREKAWNSQEESEVSTTEGLPKTTIDDNDAETALAIAAHQLLSAPLPSITNFEDEPRQSKKSSKPPTTIHEYRYTSPTYEELTTKTTYDDYSSTPIYKTTLGNQDFIQTTTGSVFDVSTRFNSVRTSPPTAFTPTKTSTYPSTPFTSRVSKPAAFTSANLLSTLTPPTEFSRLSSTTSEFSRLPSNPTTSEFSRVPSNPTVNPGFSRSPSTVRVTSSPLSSGFAAVPSSLGPSTARYVGTSDKLIPVPVEDYGFSTAGYSSISQEPSYFTREYLLESPVTKTYDEEYQYLSSTTPQSQSTTRKIPKKIAYRKISTTIRPTIQSYVPEVTRPTARRIVNRKPFEKIPVVKTTVPKRFKPVENYDYYDDGAENIAAKYAEGTKVVLHSKGTIECLDIGNFPHPASCKKFISCAKLENGSFLGWEYICPKGLSFDPIGGICNWSAGLGCHEKDA